jgi:hypothetical protein
MGLAEKLMGFDGFPVLEVTGARRAGDPHREHREVSGFCQLRSPQKPRTASLRGPGPSLLRPSRAGGVAQAPPASRGPRLRGQDLDLT